MPAFISSNSIIARVLKKLPIATKLLLGGIKVGRTLSIDPDGTLHGSVKSELTGIITGGLLSATTGATVFSISDGTGQIVDSYTDPLNPTVTEVSWTGLTGITDSYVTSEITYILLTSTGTVQQVTSLPSQSDLRTAILVGFLVHTASTIQTVVPTPVLSYQNGYLPQDILNALGTIVNGCIYSGGSGLTLARSAGTLLGRGRAYSSTHVTPNETNLSAVSPANIVTHCRNGSNTVFSASISSTTIIVNKYDDGTAAIAGVPNGTVSTNQWQVMRLHVASGGQAVVQYGQATYNSLPNAIAGVTTEVFYQDPLLAKTAFRGFLFVRGGASNLNDSSDAVFQSSGKLGDPAVSVAGSFSIFMNGFVYIPTTSGAPTGTPTTVTNFVPICYDITNNRFYAYNSGWKSVALT